MQEMKYFVPNETFDNAIRNEEKGVLKALLIGVISNDPTFSTTEYDEATAYVKAKSEKMNGSVLNLLEAYSKQEDEYAKPQESWDEEYYRMLLVWYRDNYADERLSYIKTVGKEVYKNKPTLGKSKHHNRLMSEKQANHNIVGKNTTAKKNLVVMAAGNDVRTTQLPITEWFKENWKWIATVIAVIAAVVAVICLLLNKQGGV